MRRLFFLPRAEAGFTVVELVVSMAIMGLMVGSLLVSGVATRREFALNKNTEELRALFVQAKFLAISTVGDPDLGTTPGASAPICGYGVHLDFKKSEAFIFRSVSARPSGEDPCPLDAGYLYPFTKGRDLRLVGPPYTLRLARTVAFGEEEKKRGTFDALFIPPDPVAFLSFGGSGTFVEEAVLALRAADGGGEARSIRLNRFGLVALEPFSSR